MYYQLNAKQIEVLKQARKTLSVLQHFGQFSIRRADAINILDADIAVQEQGDVDE